MEKRWVEVKGVVVEGHGIASGRSGGPRFPGGSIALQSPHFLAAGVDLSGYHPGTINISIAPRRYEVRKAAHTLRKLSWLPDYPPEDFSFFDCRLTLSGRTVDGLVYYPHPETKPEFHQDPHVLEILAPFLEGLQVGDRIVLALPAGQIAVR